MGARTRKSTSKQPEPDINVTPLVDVVLVLLIIFMVVTPAINDGEQIALPEILNPEKKKDENPIDVILAPGGRILVEKVSVADLAALEQALLKIKERTPDRKLVLNADTSLPYKDVREAFAMIQDIGIQGVSLKVLQKKKPGES